MLTLGLTYFPFKDSSNFHQSTILNSSHCLMALSFVAFPIPPQLVSDTLYQSDLNPLNLSVSGLSIFIGQGNPEVTSKMVPLLSFTKGCKKPIKPAKIKIINNHKVRGLWNKKETRIPTAGVTNPNKLVIFTCHRFQLVTGLVPQSQIQLKEIIPSMRVHKWAIITACPKKNQSGLGFE